MAEIHRVSKCLRGRSWYLDYYIAGRRHRPALGPIPETEAELQRRHMEIQLAKRAGLNIEPASAGPNPLGKDYLTMNEAALYCGVSESQFDSQYKHYGLLAVPFMGTLLFRKLDLQGAIEKQWQKYTELPSDYKDKVGISTTTLLDGVTDLPSARSRRQRPKSDASK